MPRHRSVETQTELREQTNELLEKEYYLMSSSEKRNIVKKKGVGSSRFHFVLLLFTVGLGNLIYYVIYRIRADAVRIVVESDSDTSERSTSAGEYREETWLEEQYLRNNKNTYEIADEMGVSQVTVSNWLDNRGIETGANQGKEPAQIPENTYRDEAWMQRQYVKNKRSTYEIADEVGVSRSTISRWLDKHDIETRSSNGESAKPREDTYRSESWLREQYLQNDKSTYEIADKLEVSRSTISRWLDKHGIEKGQTRGKSESARPPEDTYRDQAWLRQQYLQNDKSVTEIADEIGVSQSTVDRWINRHGIDDSTDNSPEENENKGGVLDDIRSDFEDI